MNSASYSTLANYDVMNPDSDPALRKKLDAAYDRGHKLSHAQFLEKLDVNQTGGVECGASFSEVDSHNCG